MPETIIDLDSLKAYLKVPRENSNSDEVLEMVRQGAEGYVRAYCSRQFTQASYVETFNGTNRKALRLVETPVAISPAPTVTEDGAALVVAVGYSTSADVVCDPVNGLMHRLPTGSRATAQTNAWSPGVQNITVTYTGGYTTATTPGDLRMATAYVGGILWRASDKMEIGVMSRGDAAHNISLLEDLPAIYKRILDVYKRVPTGGL